MKKIFTIAIICALMVIKSNAQSVGPGTPATYATSGVGAGWANLMGVLVVDNNPAYVDLAQYPTCSVQLCYYSNTAIFTGFGFSVPGNATIVGVRVDAMERVSSPGGGIHDSIVSISLNGSQVGSNYADTANWKDTPQINIYGGNLDTWGYAFTPADINDPTFGLQFMLTNSSYDQPASVDYLTMTVYYQAGTGIQHQTSSPWQIGFHDSHLLIIADGTVLNMGGVLEVRNLLGELFYRKVLDSAQANIDLSVDASEWVNGLYVINIRTNSGDNFIKKSILVK